MEAPDPRVQIASAVDEIARDMIGDVGDLLEWAEQILPYRKTKPAPPVNDVGLVRLVERSGRVSTRCAS